MFLDLLTFRVLVALSFVAGGFLLGVIAEKVIVAGVSKMARRTKWQGDEVIIDSFRHVVMFWGLLAGAYGAIATVYLTPNVKEVLGKILLVLAILSATAVVMRMAGGFITLYASRAEGVLPATTLIVNITKLLVFVIGILIVLQSLGISITPILTALGVGGLAVALALQDTLSNLFSGIHVIASKQVRPGDYVRLDTGEEGYVQDINWRNTTIRMLPNNMVIVPNVKLASAIVTNYHLPEEEMAVLVQVGVDYGSDLERVERVTIEVAREVMKEVPGGLSDFDPFIRYHTFADFSINFTVILRVKEFVDQYLVKHEFVKRLQKRYAEEGIVIPFPIRTVYLQSDESGGDREVSPQLR
ncbi:MAG TPA: mechanosensitive ion channel family protein [Desulfotomaculum sp.]|nr:mechanosensitive ion channel family protein [Desulfotomaculum sp.]